MKRWGITNCVLALAVVGIAAPPASAEFRDVSPSGSDASNDCLALGEGPCATIQHAVDVAENGDWIDVRPGTYAEEVVIDKPLTLDGPDGSADPELPQAVVDGDTGTAIRPTSHDITIRGMTVTASSTGTAIGTSGVNVDKLRVQEDIISGGSAGVRLEAGGEEDAVGYNLIEGVGDGIHLSGSTYSSLTIQANRFDASIGSHAVFAESGTRIEGIEVWGNHVSAPVRIAARIAKKPNQENDLGWNTFDSATGPQLAIDGNEVRIMSNSFEGNGSAGCLHVLGSQGGLVPSSKILVSLDNEFIACNPYGIELGPQVDGIKIYGNEFPGSYDGIATSNASPWDTTGHIEARDNRFVGTTHLAVDNAAAGTVDAKQNWWGCNAGPGAEGCDAVDGGVDAADPVELAARIGPRKEETGIEEVPKESSIVLDPAQQAEVAALLTGSGAEPNLGVPTEGVQVHFSSSLGMLQPSVTSLSNGWTKTIFTAAASPGQGWIVVSMDNQQTLVPVTIRGATSTLSASSASSAPVATPPPAPALVITGNRKALMGHRVTVGSIHCEVSCQATPGRARLAIGRRHYRPLVTPSGTLAAESTTPIRITLSRSSMRALKKLGNARLRVTISVIDASGQKSARMISVRLRP